MRHLFVVVLAVLVCVTEARARGTASDGPLQVIIQNNVRIDQPGCESPSGFSLSQAVANHVSYALTVKSIRFQTALTDLDSLSGLAETDSTNFGGGYRLIIKPETETRFPDSGCTGELEIRLRYCLDDDCNADQPIEFDRLASGTVRFLVDCEEEAGIEQARSSEGSVDPIKTALRQAVESLVSELPTGSGTAVLAGRPVPTVVYVDSSYIRTFPGRWLETVRVTLETASRALSDQFGWRLEMMPARVISEGLDASRSFSDLFDLLRVQLPDHDDTLAIVLYNQPTALVPGRDNPGRMELGRAQAGRRMILLEGLPDPADRNLYWLPFDNAVSMVHEFGHALGAVHVSDIFSVMHPNATWTGTARFDDFNARIVRAALEGRLTFSSPAKYVEFFVQQLNDSDYRLVDYPAVLAGYLQSAGAGRRGRMMRAVIESGSKLQATEGYLLLAMGRTRLARASFERAARIDPKQASLFYYLSLTMNDDQGARLRARAAKMGYYAAMDCRLAAPADSSSEAP